MSDYQLPRTDDGEVDWDAAAEDLLNLGVGCNTVEEYIKCVAERLEAIAAYEREACAKMALNTPGSYDPRWRETDPATPLQIAEAIRTRGNE